jgi:hypothetical protein
MTPNTVNKYITPYAKNVVRSLSKDPKIDLFQIGLVQRNSGAKKENFFHGAVFIETCRCQNRLFRKELVTLLIAH